ncbi:MAG: hypothetical protein LC808_33795 [Actinobacteria bacterium]|nr:hypothetical protein [Actinomycetota bacterium]
MAGGDGELRVDVVPWGPAPETAEAAARAAVGHPVVREALGDADFRLLSTRSIALDPGSDVHHSTGVRATVYDYTNERALHIDAPIDGSQHVDVTSSVRQPRPTNEEYRTAVEALSEGWEFGAAVREGRLRPYRPMPPLILDELPDGRVERTITVGLRPAEGSTGHEIVGVKAANGSVVRFEGRAPEGAVATERLCGPEDAAEDTLREVTGGQAKVTVSRAGEVLWSFIAVRPAASSGTDGSGIELKAVNYRGKRVLRQAHVPILNVRYDDDACGPFRDWQEEEGQFRANGTDVVPGFRLCPKPAQTIFDSGDDKGSFLGVAIYVEGDEVVLTSELEAGWYRYLSQWRLHADGTIRPRFGFAAVSHSCTCEVHHHHVYWRFDFDVVSGAHNAVREFNDPPVAGTARWHTLRHEIRRRRSPRRQRRWRVVNRVSGEGYTLVPGAEDGAADAFGIGDMWALRRRRGQLDDGASEPRAGLNRFVNGESIYDTNVVLWYAAHFSHDVGAESADDHGHVVGPELVPSRW